jgi:hypothetical protein
VPSSTILPTLVRSNLIRSFNIGYLILAPEDSGARRAVEGVEGLSLVASTPETMLYEVQGVLPRVYFASHTYPYSADGFFAGMVRNGSPPDAAFILGETAPAISPAGRVMGTRWGPSSVDIDIEAPDGGFLVISESHFPGWEARVDGAPAVVNRVNGRIMGVRVAPGARQVQLELRSPGLRRGLQAVLACVLVMLALLWRQRRAGTTKRKGALIDGSV